MKVIDTMDKLYLHTLRDLYSAEKQLVRALPKMAKAATHEELRMAMEEHLEVTKGQIERLDQIFQSLGTSSSGETCKGMKGLIEEGEELMTEKKMEPDVLDAALIQAAQKIEHYEIAGYGTARTYAQMLGREDDAELLQMTLDEEGETDEKLTALAEGMINQEALAGVGAEDEEEEE